jgi:hypothetical protein
MSCPLSNCSICDPTFDNYLLQAVWVAAIFGMRKPEFSKQSRKDLEQLWVYLGHPAYPMTALWCLT